MFRFALSVLAMCSLSVSYAGTDETASAFVLCKNQQKEVRTIRVTQDQKTKEGCSISYSKGGVDEIVGGSRSSGGCRSILQDIRSKLEVGKWDCRSVSKATITSSSEVITQ